MSALQYVFWAEKVWKVPAIINNVEYVRVLEAAYEKGVAVEWTARPGLWLGRHG